VSAAASLYSEMEMTQEEIKL